MEAVSRTRVGFADERRPLCLFPVNLESTPPFSPIDCGKRAVRRSHSIQENGSLWDISYLIGQGRSVYQFFPDVGHLVEHTRNDSNRIASKWLWDVASLPPRKVPITRASTNHFACDVHDGPTYLGRADNLKFSGISGHFSFDDRRTPAEFEELEEQLFYLAYRTLSFRISQFRGTEKEAARFLALQVLSNNRFGVRSCHEAMQEVSSTLTELFRFKNGFDRRILGETSAIRLVHHIVPFKPVIRYVASEYMPLEHLLYRGEDHIWVSLNVLFVDGRSWLILSHQTLDNHHRNSLVHRSVFDLAFGSDSDRKKADFDAFVTWTNLFASIEDFRGMLDQDKASIGSRIAWHICEEPYSKGLEILRSSPSGADEIARAISEIRNE